MATARIVIEVLAFIYWVYGMYVAIGLAERDQSRSGITFKDRPIESCVIFVARVILWPFIYTAAMM